MTDEVYFNTYNRTVKYILGDLLAYWIPVQVVTKSNPI